MLWKLVERENLMARRFFTKKGKTTGWIGYFWHGQTESLKILTLVSGFHKYDRRHDISFGCYDK